MKKCTLFMFTGLLCIGSLVGCGKREVTEKIEDNSGSKVIEDTESSEETVNPNYTVPFEWSDIDWTVEQQVVYGDREYVIYYTNNTDNDILQLDIEYVKKSDTTDEQMLENFADFRKENGGYKDDDDIIDFGLDARNYRYTQPGKTAEPFSVTIGNGWKAVTTDDQFNLFEPDIATIAYSDGDKIFIAYYDFKTEKLSCNPSEAMNKYTWSSDKLGKLIPEPEYDIVLIDYDEEDYFSFDIYGVTVDDYTKYKEACIQAGGFDNEIEYEYDTSYKATNSDGVEFLIEYLDGSNRIGCVISIDEDKTN